VAVQEAEGTVARNGNKYTIWNILFALKFIMHAKKNWYLLLNSLIKKICYIKFKFCFAGLWHYVVMQVASNILGKHAYIFKVEVNSTLKMEAVFVHNLYEHLQDCAVTKQKSTIWNVTTMKSSHLIYILLLNICAFAKRRLKVI
jgi:hypothetical protein